MFWLNTPAALDFGGTNLSFVEHRRVLQTLSRDLSARPFPFQDILHDTDCFQILQLKECSQEVELRRK